MKRSMAAVLIVLATGLVTSQDVYGAILTSSGANSILAAHNNNVFYIPLQTSTSGTLGGSAGQGKYLGLWNDKVRLGLPGNSTSTGSIGINETFALAEPMDLATARLKLTFDDLDLFPQYVTGGRYSESLTITYHRSDGTDATLALSSGNYTEFRTDGRTLTDNVNVTYYIDLAADLGLTQTDIDSINSNLSLPISFTMASTTTRTSPGSATYMNTPETFSATLEYQPAQGAPEPMTLALTIAGLPLLIRRKRS